MTRETSEEGVPISLLAFFPGKLLTMTFNNLIFISVMFVALWPWRKDLPLFLHRHQSPFLAFPIFVAVIVLYSYIQLRFGRGELLQERNRRLFSSALLQEREREFSRCGLPMLLLHTGFFLLPFGPLLILAASGSELPLQPLLAASGMIWMSGLLCRIGGLLLYRLLGVASILGFFLARSAFGLFLFLVPIYSSQFSPILILRALCKNESLLDGEMPLYTAYWLCLGTMLALAVLLFFIARLAAPQRG